MKDDKKCTLHEECKLTDHSNCTHPGGGAVCNKEKPTCDKDKKESCHLNK